jgi:endo-1,4-beta-xylanase
MKERILLAGLLFVFGLLSCKKDIDSTPPSPPPPQADTVTILKNAVDFPIGFAVDYTLFKNNAVYAGIVAREADRITFENHLKHGMLVADDGTINYSRADELLQLATNAGLSVYGHTLVWHEGQNSNYLRSLTVGAADPTAENLLPEGGFEDGTGATSFTGWSLLTGGSSVGSFAAATGRNSTRALEATVTTAGANPWDMQALGPAWTATVGKQYIVTVDVKASAANGRVRLVNQAAQYQQFEITPTTTWTTYTWTLTTLETAPQIRLHFPVAGVYTIDNIRIADASAITTLPAAQVAKEVDTAMSRFIRNTVSRYAGRITAWDVVNEAIFDGSGAVRITPPSNAGTNFYWGQYLGRDFALKAFQYAKAADGAALLFINDYNLESDNRKLDSLLAYVTELKAKGATIDGIGTQMHIGINTSQTGIENMFRKLAATGLKVKVTELDVRMNPANTTPFTQTAELLASQAAMYRYVAEAYIRLVPATQRYGITMWGVADHNSWLYNNGRDHPLLYDVNYQKKPAFAAFLQGLKTK